MPVVELWELEVGGEGVLALRRGGSDSAWVDLDRVQYPERFDPRNGRRLSPFCVDAKRLGDFRGSGGEEFDEWRQAGAREIEWDEFRATAPVMVATWKMGIAHITRDTDRVQRGGRPGPLALRYMSPNGPTLPTELLQLGRWLVGREAAEVIGVTPRTMRELPVPADGGDAFLLVARREGRDWMFEPMSVYEYAASIRKTGPGSLRRRIAQRKAAVTA